MTRQQKIDAILNSVKYWSIPELVEHVQKNLESELKHMSDQGIDDEYGHYVDDGTDDASEEIA